MAIRIDDRTWEVQGETVRLPVTMTDARLTMQVFTPRVATVAPVLADTPLRPFTVFGRAITMLMVVHYPDWALKSYDEVAVALMVRGPRGGIGTHIVDLPVTGAFTREAGEDIWALPKWLMSGEFTFLPSGTTAMVRDGDAQVLWTIVPTGRVRLPFGIRGSLPHWAYLDRGAQAGKLLRGRIPFNFSGVRLGRAGYQGLGIHPMVETMRAFGMDKRPLMTMTAARWFGDFGVFTEVSATV